MTPRRRRMAPPSPRMEVTLDNNTLNVLPMGSGTAVATIRTSNATQPGANPIRFVAQETVLGAPQNDPAYADYTFTLTTTGSGDASGDNTSTPAAHAPLLTPTSLRIEAPPNGSEQSAFLRVGNP